MAEGGTVEPGSPLFLWTLCSKLQLKDDLQEIATSLPGCTWIGNGQGARPQSHPLVALKEQILALRLCLRKVLQIQTYSHVVRHNASPGHGQLPASLTLRYHGCIYMTLTFPVHVPRSLRSWWSWSWVEQSGWARLRCQGMGGAGAENLSQGGRTACELWRAPLCLWTSLTKQKFKDNITKNFMPATIEH